MPENQDKRKINLGCYRERICKDFYDLAHSDKFAKWSVENIFEILKNQLPIDFVESVGEDEEIFFHVDIKGVALALELLQSKPPKVDKGIEKLVLCYIPDIRPKSDDFNADFKVFG